MTIARVLDRLTRAGLRLSIVPPDKVAVEPKAALTDELRRLILQHKPDIIRALQAANDEPKRPHTAAVKALLAAHDPDPAPHRWWRVRYADRTTEVCCSPPQTRAQVLADYPGAVDAEPIRDEPRTGAPANALKAEAEKLISAARLELGWTHEDVRDFLDVSFAEHPQAAVTALRELLALVRRERKRDPLPGGRAAAR